MYLADLPSHDHLGTLTMAEMVMLILIGLTIAGWMLTVVYLLWNEEEEDVDLHLEKLKAIGQSEWEYSYDAWVPENGTWVTNEYSWGDLDKAERMVRHSGDETRRIVRRLVTAAEVYYSDEE